MPAKVRPKGRNVARNVGGEAFSWTFITHFTSSIKRANSIDAKTSKEGRKTYKIRIKKCIIHVFQCFLGYLQIVHLQHHGCACIYVFIHVRSTLCISVCTVFLHRVNGSEATVGGRRFGSHIWVPNTHHSSPSLLKQCIAPP